MSGVKIAVGSGEGGHLHNTRLANQARMCGIEVVGAWAMIRTDVDGIDAKPTMFGVWFGAGTPPAHAHVWGRVSWTSSIDAEIDAAMKDCDTHGLHSVVIHNPGDTALGYSVSHIALSRDGVLRSFQSDHDLHMHLLHLAAAFHVPAEPGREP